MKVNSKYIVFALLLSLLFSISAVAAQENITFEQSNENNDLIQSTDANHKIEKTNLEETLKDTTYSFSEIQEKIDNSSSGSTIYLDGQTYKGSSPINITKDNLTISGASSSNDNAYSLLDAEGISSIMNITASNIIIRNIIFYNGNSTEGGAIKLISDYVRYDNLTIEKCSFINNKAENGGAIAIHGSDNIIINECNFAKNTAYSGGAIDLNGFNLTITNSVFRDNTAQTGGAVMASGISESRISNCNFTNNKAKNGNNSYYAGCAGALTITGINIRLTDSYFADNSADHLGGAVLWYCYNGIIDNCTFINNHANSSGALGGSGDNCTLVNSRFIKNSADHIGGAVIWDVRDSSIAESEFTGNSAPLAGAIYSTGDNGTVSANTFTSNSASQGSVIWVNGPNNSFINNTVDSSNKNPVYVTDLTNFTYNNLREDQITYNPYIIDIDSYTILQVNKTLEIKVNVHDMLGNSLKGYVYCLAENHDWSYYSYDDGELVDGKFTLNLKPAENLEIIDVGIACDWEDIVHKSMEKKISILIADIQQLNNTVKVKLPKNSTGNVTLKIGDKVYSKLLNNTTVTFDLTDLVNGSYNAQIGYDNFTCNMTVKITGSNRSAVITASDVMGIAGEIIEVPATIYDDLGNPIDGAIINCKINSIGYDANETSHSGKVTFKIPVQNTVNCLDLTVTFSNYSKTFKSLIVNVTQSDNKVTVTLPLGATGNVTLTVGNKNYIKVLENSRAVIDLNDLNDGNYTAELTYSGDGAYPNVSGKIHVSIFHPPVIPVYKLTGGDISVLYSGKAVYRVLLTRDGKPVAGENVVIRFNGKEVTLQTDKDGYAVFKIDTNIKIGSYDIEATSNGEGAKNKVVINQIIKAPNKKVKKSKKVTKVKITLKKVDGKYLAKKALKIKFNKKTYKVKTNKKGKAVWKVKKSMLKKFKAGKNVKYTVTYGKDVLTKKLIIKK